MTSSRAASLAAYAACVAIWGTTWLAIKVALLGFPPILGAGIRFVLASGLLGVFGRIARVEGRRDKPPRHLVLVLAFSMFGLNYALTYVAETHLASGLVAVLFGTMPFFIFGFAHPMVGERTTWATVAGAIVAFAGVALISIVGSVRGDALFILAAVIASASSGFANVYLKRFSHAEPFATLPPAMLLAGVGLTSWGAIFEHVNVGAALRPAPLAAMLYLAMFGSAIAFYLNHWLLRRIDSGVMGLSALMIPVIAVVVGAAFGGEVLGPRDLVGALLVVGGVSISMFWVAPHVERSGASHGTS